MGQKRYGPSGGLNDDFATSVQQTADGGFIIGGSSWSFNGGHNYDFLLLKLNATGGIIWQKTYDTFVRTAPVPSSRTRTAVTF